MRYRNHKGEKKSGPGSASQVDKKLEKRNNQKAVEQKNREVKWKNVITEAMEGKIVKSFDERDDMAVMGEEEI